MCTEYFCSWYLLVFVYVCVFIFIFFVFFSFEGCVVWCMLWYFHALPWMRATIIYRQIDLITSQIYSVRVRAPVTQTLCSIAVVFVVVVRQWTISWTSCSPDVWRISGVLCASLPHLLSALYSDNTVSTPLNSSVGFYLGNTVSTLTLGVFLSDFVRLHRFEFEGWSYGLFGAKCTRQQIDRFCLHSLHADFCNANFRYYRTIWLFWLALYCTLAVECGVLVHYFHPVDVANCLLISVLFDDQI